MFPTRSVGHGRLKPCLPVRIDGETDYFQAVVSFVSLRQFFEELHFVTAGAAPGGPYVDIADFSFQAGKVYLRAVPVLHLQVEQFLARAELPDGRYFRFIGLFHILQCGGVPAYSGKERIGFFQRFDGGFVQESGIHALSRETVQYLLIRDSSRQFFQHVEVGAFDMRRLHVPHQHEFRQTASGIRYVVQVNVPCEVPEHRILHVALGRDIEFVAGAVTVKVVVPAGRQLL